MKNSLKNLHSNRRLAERRVVVEFEGAWKILFDFQAKPDPSLPDNSSGREKSGYEKAPEGGDSVLYPVWLRLKNYIRTFFKENPAAII